MAEWIKSNLANILVVIVLCAALFFIIRSLVRSRKAGKTSCGCDCGSCALQGKCHGRS